MICELRYFLDESWPLLLISFKDCNERKGNSPGCFTLTTRLILQIFKTHLAEPVLNSFRQFNSSCYYKQRFVSRSCGHGYSRKAVFTSPLLRYRLRCRHVKRARLHVKPLSFIGLRSWSHGWGEGGSLAEVILWFVMLGADARMIDFNKLR